MKQTQKTFKTRVDILTEKGTEELFTEEIYSLLSNSGTWIEENGNDIVIKSYPEDIEIYLEYLKKLKINIKKTDIKKEEQQDYAGLTKKYFRPIKIGDITIFAPWNKQNTNRRSIIIDPGMAFGTGRHESTRIMMKLMEHINMEDKTVLDLGCGSGILSINAVLLGARKVTSIDNDADTVFSAKKNVALNNTEKISLACTDLQHVSGRYDIVLANLDIRTFTSYSEKIKEFVKRYGYIIVSGILWKERKKLVPLFHPFLLTQTEKKNAWCGFVFGRNV
ncbi:MAG: 50S ribosomal protein L11 methyltransferase [Proteobacteria bacterium]|nr:50S ribosomal protein L11 methyltransferase [Pseudomonadota bacterium]